jgi:hypothetical protein
VGSPASWPGQDLARGVALDDGGPGGWVLDAFGGLHAFGGAPGVAQPAYWPGWDIARGVVVDDDSGPGGWVLDGFGGLHPFGGAPRVESAVYWPGWDIARGIVANPKGDGGWIADGFGGVHAFGGAPAVAAAAYWPGWDIARGAAGGGAGSGARAAAPPLPPVTRVLTYSIATRGPVRSDLATFVANAEATYADGRGWRAAGIEFRRVASGGDFTLWLATPDEVARFSSSCSSFYSCRVGRNVIVNDDRFAGGSPFWPGSVADYRNLVVNHETGHFLGLGHAGCAGAGLPAPVMQQQSKGLDGCTPNPWPTAGEIAAVS